MPNNHGVTGGLNTTLPTVMTISAFTAIAWTNALELNVRIWMTFKKYTGLYFWSLLISSWGVILHDLAFILKFFRVLGNEYVTVTIITIGWWGMVTGQALVLYSRLHLLLRDRRRLRWVLYMIIVDAIIFHLPTTVLTYGSNSSNPGKFDDIYMIYEKIQMTAFSIQEVIISSLYIYETQQLLKPSESFHKERVRRVMRHLIYINILIIFLDVALLATEYASLYEIETTMKGAVYGFKLRLEFSILNQLRAIIQGNRDNNSQLSFSRSGAQNRGVHGHSLHLGALSHSGGLPGLPASPETPNAYSVFVGKNQKSPIEPFRREDAGVMKTTEVVVQTSELNGRQKELYEGSQTETSGASDHMVQPVPTAGRPRNGTYSSSTSEIEFARHGV